MLVVAGSSRLPPVLAEQQAISNMIAHFGKGVFATVMDSFDYQRVRGREGREVALQHDHRLLGLCT